MCWFFDPDLSVRVPGKNHASFCIYCLRVCNIEPSRERGWHLRLRTGCRTHGHVKVTTLEVMTLPAQAGRAVRPARRPGWPGLAWLACPSGQQGRPGRPGQPSRPGRPSRPTYVLTYVRTYVRASVLTDLPLANSVSQLALAPTIAKYEKGLDGATKDPLTNLQLLPIRCSGNLGVTRICCCTKKECPYDWLRHGDCHFTTGFGTAVANAGGWLVGGHGSCQLGGPPLHD